MKGRICLCPASIKWIVQHLEPGLARKQFAQMIGKAKRRIGVIKRKTKRRTAKQRAATRRLIAFNKRRRR